MYKPKISVIVPVYKVEKYLMQCIDSILNQTLRDIEVILVDEGDIDECRAIIDMYEFGLKKDSRIRTIHEKNGGYGASVNKGMAIAQGEYISIIESDDFIASDMFEKMYNYAKNLDADIVKTPYYEYWDKNSFEPELRRYCFWGKWVTDVPENKLFSIKDYPIFMGIHPSVWSCIYKKEYFDKYNIRFLTDKGAYVDHHFKAESLLNTDKIAWLNEPFYYYRLSNENASASKLNLPVMIRRWNEFHKLINEKYKDIYPYFANYNLREEYVNTFGKIKDGNFSLSEKDIKLLSENLGYITEESIKNSVNMLDKDINWLLKLKKEPLLMNSVINNSLNKADNLFCQIYLFQFIKIGVYKENYKKAYWLKLFNLLPFAKIKRRRGKLKLYLFGFLPVMKSKALQREDGYFPKISVIVPVYKVAKYLRKCLDSILNQTFQNFEIILVSDGPDEDERICEEYASKDKRITLIKGINKGLGGARNAGLKIAKGEFIAFVDSDDWIEPEYLEKMYQAIVFDSDVDIAQCGTNIVFDGEVNEKVKADDECYFKINNTGKVLLNNDIFGKMNVGVWNKLYKNELIKKYNIRFPKNMHNEDAYFVWAYWSVCKNMYCIEDKLYNYLRREGSLMAETFAKRIGGGGGVNDHLKIGEMFYYFLIRKNIFKERESAFYNAYYICWLFVQSYGTEEYKRIGQEIAEIFLKNKNIPKNQYNIFEILNKSNRNTYRNSFFENIFSIKNTRDKKHKVITICGIKTKLRQIHTCRAK